MTFSGPCFPLLDMTALQKFGEASWNEGFYGRFLIGRFWHQVPILRDVWYTASAVQLVVSAAGVMQHGGKRFFVPERLRPKAVDYPGNQEDFNDLTEHTIPFFLYVWQFWLAILNILLPSQQCSTTTFAIIFFHVWAELPSFVIRIVILCLVRPDFQSMGTTRLKHALWIASRVLVVLFIINLVLYMTTANPYIQGLLGSFAFIADLGNAFVAPCIAYRMSRVRTALNAKHKIAHRWEEGLLGAMQVLHVVLYYPQGWLACNFESVALAAGYMTIVQLINVIALIGYTVQLFTRVYSNSEDFEREPLLGRWKSPHCV